MLSHGLNTSGLVSQELNSPHYYDQAPVDYWMSVGGAPGFFIRQDRTHPLVGPYSYNEAVHQAKYMSKTYDGKTAEIIRFVGLNPTDVTRTRPYPNIVLFYYEGKRFATGSVAEEVSRTLFVRDPGPLG